MQPGACNCLDWNYPRKLQQKLSAQRTTSFLVPGVENLKYGMDKATGLPYTIPGFSKLYLDKSLILWLRFQRCKLWIGREIRCHFSSLPWSIDHLLFLGFLNFGKKLVAAKLQPYLGVADAGMLIGRKIQLAWSLSFFGLICWPYICKKKTTNMVGFCYDYLLIARRSPTCSSIMQRIWQRTKHANHFSMQTYEACEVCLSP